MERNVAQTSATRPGPSFEETTFQWDSTARWVVIKFPRGSDRARVSPVKNLKKELSLR